MPKMNIQKTMLINAPLHKVHEVVGNFNSWSTWSPWLICEPDTKVTVNDDGSFYSWEGKRVGTGQMKVLQSTDHRIDYDLTFLKPWKSQAEVSFILSEENGKTAAKWTMNSKLPFFMFFMKTKMEKLVGMDYERGLKMLKEYVEEGKVHSRIDFLGIQSFKGQSYIGVKTKTTMSAMGDKMREDLMRLSTFSKENGIELSGKPFSQYHKFDFVTEEVEYTTGVPVKTEPTNLSGGLFFGTLGEFSMNVVRHTGKYDHMGNAWSTQIMMTRNKEFKQSKRIHPFEIYHNNPMDTPAEELVTDICFPIK